MLVTRRSPPGGSLTRPVTLRDSALSIARRYFLCVASETTMITVPPPSSRARRSSSSTRRAMACSVILAAEAPFLRILLLGTAAASGTTPQSHTMSTILRMTDIFSFVLMDPRWDPL